MTYEFECKCGNTETINCSMDEVSNMRPVCPECGHVMKRVWSTSFVIPENLKGDNYQDSLYVKDLMKNRPTGKRKSIY
jgi:predicted nucleic acid-binding Zn ribbon protein